MNRTISLFNILVFGFLIGSPCLHAEDLAGSQGIEQNKVAAVERMPRLPKPLAVRDWPTVSRAYYSMVLNPKTDLDGHRLVVIEPGEPGFRMPSFLPNRLRHESVACMSAVIGTKLVGLDPRNHNGVDWVQAAKAWYDPKTGLYRSDLRRHGPVVHSGIYGYWAATMGIMLAAQHPDDPELQKHLHTTIKGFDTIAHGLGCPENPDFNGLGFNFETGKPDGRNEPMNRLGNAPSVAWPLVVGASLEPDTADDRVACARAALQWHIDHPNRYELTNVMGPLAAARLNAEHHTDIDIGAIFDIWFGDKNGKGDRSKWMITAGAKVDGMTLDGLDGARWDPQGNDFYAFAMGTLHGPAWLVPVVRYDQRYARAIARFSLHVANNSRLFQAEGLDWDHQDHKDWKDKWDPRNLLFYEALAAWEWSDERKFRPYATGDTLRLGWEVAKISRKDYLMEKPRFSKSCNNLSLYSGNHIGFLGGICEPTDVPGILIWDCLKTDWLHSKAYPTRLIYNPHDFAKQVALKLTHPTDLYDLVTGQFIARGAEPGYRVKLAADQVAVLVILPANAMAKYIDGQLLMNEVVVDYHPQRNP